MSGIHNKNIIFYSNYPQDKLSAECLTEISKNETVKNQFILLCVHDLYSINSPPPYRLPKKIIELKDKGLMPILCISGFKNYILANSALTWLKANSEKEINGGVEGYSVESSGFADNCSTIEQAEIVGLEHFNSEYNLGFSSGKGEVGKSYSNIEEVTQAQIVTYDTEDSSSGAMSSEKKRAAQEMQKRLDTLQTQRREEANNTNGINGIQQRQSQQMPSYDTESKRSNFADRQFFNPIMQQQPQMPRQNQHSHMPLMPRMNTQQTYSPSFN